MIKFQCINVDLSESPPPSLLFRTKWPDSGSDVSEHSPGYIKFETLDVYVTESYGMSSDTESLQENDEVFIGG